MHSGIPMKIGSAFGVSSYFCYFAYLMISYSNIWASDIPIFGGVSSSGGPYEMNYYCWYGGVAPIIPGYMGT